MRAVLKGNVHLPPLPFVNEYQFDGKVASSVMSAMNHAQNHVIPDRIKEISKENGKYKAHQQRLQQQYEDEEQEKHEKVTDINYQHLIQDCNTNNIAFAQSKQRQNEIIAQQQHEYRWKAPNLMDGDDDDQDNDNDDNDDNDCEITDF